MGQGKKHGWSGTFFRPSGIFGFLGTHIDP